MNLGKTLNKINVLRKGELLERLKFLVKSHTGLLRIRNLNGINVKANKIDIFNDQLFEKKNPDSFIDVGCILNKISNFKSNEKPWYKISISDFDGDIREYWEFNRLQFLNIILNQYLQTNDQMYLKQINEIISAWFSANPLEKGYCHVSNLEIAIRSIVFYRIWFYLSDKLTIDLERVLYVYGVHLFNDLPRTNVCNPNNHSLGEAVTLYFLSLVFKISKWKKVSSKTIFRRLKLFSIDGCSREESSGYLLFKTQMLLFLRNLDCTFNEQIDNLLPKIIARLNDISDCEGNIALFGDCDDGLFYIFESLKKNNISQLSINSFINYMTIQKIVQKSKEYIFDESNYLLTKTEGKIKVALIGGYEINHGHNQCLSICVWENGMQRVFLPGTYRYNNISFDKRTYYCGLKRQNCPRSFDRKNLITRFRHKQIIKKTNIFINDDMLCGISESKKDKLTRKIKIYNDRIIVSDDSEKMLKEFSICCDKKCLVTCKNGLIKKEIDCFSRAYGEETLKEYVTIIPSCNHCEFVIQFKQ